MGIHIVISSIIQRISCHYKIKKRSIDHIAAMDQVKDSSKCTNTKCKCPTCTCGSGCTCNVSPEVVCDPCKEFKAEMDKKQPPILEINLQTDEHLLNLI